MRHHDHDHSHDHHQNRDHDRAHRRDLRDSTPFDGELIDSNERSADMTAQFWGSGSDWSERTSRLPAVTRSARRDDTTGSMRVIRDGVAAFRPQRRELRDATGQIRRTRAHGGAASVDATPTIEQARADATIAQLAAGYFDEPLRATRPADPYDDSYDMELSASAPARRPQRPTRGADQYDDAYDIELSAPAPGRRIGFGAVDPLIARLGALVVVGVLLVPVALALRPADTASGSVQIEAPTGDAPAAVQTDATAAATAVAESPGPTASAGATSAAVAASASTAATQAPAESAAPQPTTSETSASSDSSAGDDSQATSATSASSTSGAIDEPAVVDEPAERVEPACPQTYTAAPGDSWYRIADAAGVAPAALLDENRATVDTVIFPGDDICLPAGATMPSRPATTAAPTTNPTTTNPTTTNAPATTTAPTTTAAPATTAPAGSPGRNATPDQVKAVIRSVFPESEWETAYFIASRESKFVPTAYNGWCCYGVFQIYWNVHKSWLDDLGIDSADDLYDPVLNVRAAYAIYQRAGNSWSPWSTYSG